MTPIAILKTNVGRQPVPSKAGTGLNAFNVPYTPVKKIGAIPSSQARRPTGRK
jgi:hypothetical protein